MKRLLPLLVLLLTLAPRPASAHLRNYLVNYGWYTLEKGRAEVELFTDYSADNELFMHQSEVEVGITDRWSLGLYGVFLEGVGLTAFKAENRYRFGHKGEWPVDVAGYLELKKANGTTGVRGEHDELEAKLLLSKDAGNLNLVSNVIMAYEKELEPSGEEEYETETGVSFGAAYPMGKVTPGLEVLFQKDHSQLIPGLYIDVMPNVRLNLGVGLGFGSNTEDTVYKSILELEF